MLKKDLGLLTLIIVMYDRFRGQRSRRIAALAI